ncbi:Uncharacterised protein [Vibrio cholerae]|nr:Uncharacterised protein [Vibrio cholerae]CSI54834.1 Uncharacterised protein [Vibrio cholerae]
MISSVALFLLTHFGLIEDFTWPEGLRMDHHFQAMKGLFTAAQ